ncbi:MAG: transglycosylase SLT domain-containing protein [Candidatus Gracilibacteria bacterium]
MTTNIDTQDKKNTDLLLSIDALDGKVGDSTGMESKIVDKIFSIHDAEKKEEAIVRMIALTRIGAELQSNYQKRNLLAGMNSGDIDSSKGILETIKKLERAKLRIIRFAEVKDNKESSGDITARQEILKQHTGLETVRASDILMLKKQGADLAKLLLVPEKDSFATVSRETLKSTDSFIVNFGESKNINNIIGAGDILPASVSRVKINGVEGERKNTQRPGYYDVKTGKYLPIYDGDKIEIIDNTGKVDEKIEKESEEKWLHERRIEDTIENNGNPLSTLQEDIDLQEKVKQEKVDRIKLGVDFSSDDTIDNGENLKGHALWENEKFQSKLTEVCNNLGVKKEDMKIIMTAESRLNPKVVNHTSGATGLIQFMPKTALGLHTTVGALRKMTSIEQLDYVEKYFLPYKGKLNSPKDLYLATFYPAAIGKPEDFVMGSEPHGVSPEIIARQNSVVALGKSVITVADFNDYVERKERNT